VNRVDNNDKNNNYHYHKFVYVFAKNKLRKATIRSVVLVRPSVLMSQLDWRNICVNVHWEFLLQSVYQVQV
jgi:hypothetical protein